MAYQTGLFNDESILEEEQYNITHDWQYKQVHTFPEGISTKLVEIALLEFELVSCDVAVQYFSHYTTETLPN